MDAAYDYIEEIAIEYDDYEDMDYNTEVSCYFDDDEY